MVRVLMIGTLMMAGAFAPSLAWGQTTTAAEDPNEKAAHERTFEETGKHMQLHSEWSKKSGKMNDN